MNVINQNWIFGHNAHIDFSNLQSGAAQSTPLTKIDTVEGCASVSDDNGNLLFYTDGVTIWDTGGTKINQNDLQGDSSSTQSCIIVPDSYNKGQYYIFTTGGSSFDSKDIGLPHIGPFNSSTKHFNGVLLDTNTWTVSNLPWQPSLLSPGGTPDNSEFSPAEKLTAIQHENCKDYWIITAVQRKEVIQPDPVNPNMKNPFTNSQNARSCNMQHGLGVFRVFLINGTGLHHVEDWDMSDNDRTYFLFEMGYLKASHNGTTLAIANGHSGAIAHGTTTVDAGGSGNGEVLLFNFNRITGAITFDRRFEAREAPTLYGIAFSPDNSLLYFANFPNVADGIDGLIFQTPVNTPHNTVIDAIITIPFPNPQAGVNPANPMGALQLAPDGNIYIAMNERNQLAAITNPNGLGLFDTVLNPTGCDFVREAVFLNNDATGGLGLPNLLVAPCAEDSPCDCDCSCPSCNKDAKAQNEELIARAKEKMLKGQSGEACAAPFSGNCEQTYVKEDANPEPCFYFHWGNQQDNEITSPETEVFYLTVCNPFKDIRFNGLKITKVSLFAADNPDEETAVADIQIVPDRFICMDCLMPCSCQTRELALIARAADIAGGYKLEVTYCYESIALAPGGSEGTVSFPIEITG